jgi:hypothetical protein
MSVTNISNVNRYILWGKAAGRCQFRGCNRPLFQDALTKGQFNQAYIAHIVADVTGGPRGHPTRSDLLKNDLTNLMLLCDVHHRMVDNDENTYTEPLLLQMKREHEDRVETVAGIASDMQSHIVVYKSNVGIHTPVVSYESVREYLLPEHYPAQSSAIDLSLSNSVNKDTDTDFWKNELKNLEDQFGEQLRPKLRKSEVKHLSLFAIAPMPLLMKLGTMVNDIQSMTINQLQRDPKTWKLSDGRGSIKYIVQRPNINHPTVALNISLSATITNDRIEKVLGKDCSVYTLTIKEPVNDFLKKKVQLADFSLAVRKLLDEIKRVHGQDTVLNIFPTMPVATAVEFGRIWMPKADMRLVIYDENYALGGFVRALEIGT